MKYLVVDPQPTYIVTLGQMLWRRLEIPSDDIMYSSTAEGTIEKLASTQEPLLVLIDVALPGRPNRLALVSEMARLAPNARIVVYSADVSSFLAEDLRQAGALAVVSKCSSEWMLLRAIEEASRGRGFVDASIDLSGTADHPWRKLSDGQRETLLALCGGKSMTEIASLENRKFNSISSRKQSAFDKLKISNKPDLYLATYLHENGLSYLLDK